jgi:ryanodine receptor 2
MKKTKYSFDSFQEDKVELVTTCCKFLSYFCRTSRLNQRAMFEHLSYLLENSSMLLCTILRK